MGKLFKIIYRIIYKVGKTFHLLKNVIRTLQKIRGQEETVRQLTSNRVFLTLKIFQVRVIFWEALRSCFQEIFSYNGKVLLERRIFYYATKFIDIIINSLSQSFQEGRRGGNSFLPPTYNYRVPNGYNNRNGRTSFLWR